MKKSKWKISKHEFYTVYHFALQYNDWVAEYKTLAGINALSGDAPGGSGPSDPTAVQAVKLSELYDKISLVEKCVRLTDESLYRYILKGVTQENVTYNYLERTMRIPCSRGTYYSLRRKFYYLLNQQIGAK